MERKGLGKGREDSQRRGRTAKTLRKMRLAVRSNWKKIKCPNVLTVLSYREEKDTTVTRNPDGVSMKSEQILLAYRVLSGPKSWATPSEGTHYHTE